MFFLFLNLKNFNDNFDNFLLTLCTDILIPPNAAHDINNVFQWLCFKLLSPLGQEEIRHMLTLNLDP